MRGQFVVNGKVFPNTVVTEGDQAFLKMLMQGNNVIVPSGVGYYIGLCGSVFTRASTMADLAGEPSTSIGGYARQPAVRNATDWTVALVNGIYRAQSKALVFTAAGGNIGPFRRCFLASSSAGTGGTLFSVSAPFPVDETILDGASLTVHYELFLK